MFDVYERFGFQTLDGNYVAWADAFVEVELIYGTAVLYEMKGSIHVGAGVGVESQGTGVPTVARFCLGDFGFESAHSWSEG